MRMTVIGTGYLGATHAVGMAELGHEVIGVDVEPAKIRALAAGRPPFYEPGLGPLLRKHVDSGRLAFTTSYRKAANFADVHFLCVGTPQSRAGRGTDLSNIEAAVRELGRYLRRPSLVVGKSTVPVGTASRAESLLASAAPGVAVDVAWNPEFLREGHAVADTLSPDRIVLGIRNGRGETQLRQIYAPIIERGCPLVVTDFQTAELVKVAANSFLATKISFINAVAEVCDLVNGDVVTLARALGHDERIGPRFLQAGVGFGGGCLPKDARAFHASATELGASGVPALMAAVDAVNDTARSRVVEAAAQLLGGDLQGRPVAVLGAAFKPDSDDIRDSPALAVAQQLHERGAAVRVHDPEAVPNAQRAHPQLSYPGGTQQTLSGVELVVLATEWTEFAELDPVTAAGWVASPRMLDARNALSPGRWRSAGWSYRGIGAGFRD